MDKQPTLPKLRAWLRLGRTSKASPSSEATRQDSVQPSSSKGSRRSSNEDESSRPAELNVWIARARARRPAATPCPQAPSPRLRYMDNPEDEQVILLALVVCRDDEYTHTNLERHVLAGEQIPIQRLKRGDVVFLCTKHELYGPAQRRYLYWGTGTSRGERYLVFLTLVTNNGRGVVWGLHNWFLESTAYSFCDRPHFRNNTYVSWTQAVAIYPPRRDSVFGYVDEREQITRGDLRDVEEYMVHLMEHHKDDISYFCQQASRRRRSARPWEGSRRGKATHCGVDGCTFSNSANEAWAEVSRMAESYVGPASSEARAQERVGRPRLRVGA